MKRVALLVAVLFAFVSVMVFAAEKNVGPESFTINDVQKKMGPVQFPHRLHQEQIKKHPDFFKEDCKTCHHKRQGDATPVRCAVCHGKVKEAPAFKKAMHNKCKKCHKAMKKANVKTGPKKCSGCHKKK